MIKKEGRHDGTVVIRSEHPYSLMAARTAGPNFPKELRRKADDETLIELTRELRGKTGNFIIEIEEQYHSALQLSAHTMYALITTIRPGSIRPGSPPPPKREPTIGDALALLSQAMDAEINKGVAAQYVAHKDAVVKEAADDALGRIRNPIKEEWIPMHVAEAIEKREDMRKVKEVASFFDNKSPFTFDVQNMNDRGVIFIPIFEEGQVLSLELLEAMSRARTKYQAMYTKTQRVPWFITTTIREIKRLLNGLPHGMVLDKWTGHTLPQMDWPQSPLHGQKVYGRYAFFWILVPGDQEDI